MTVLLFPSSRWFVCACVCVCVCVCVLCLVSDRDIEGVGVQFGRMNKNGPEKEG